MKKLLMADDESGVRSLVRMTFESEAYEILEASDGNQALKLAREHQPDVVLLDVAMPGMSGFDVCRSLKEDPETQQIKVIMLTARAQQMDMEEGQKSGADDYFTKPFSPVVLMKKVEEIFDANKL